MAGKIQETYPIKNFNHWSTKQSLKPVSVRMYVFFNGD